MARKMSASESKVVRTRTWTCGWSPLIRPMASTSSTSGMRWSISTTSGRSWSVSCTASSPFPASPTTCRSGFSVSMPSKPARTMGWSSAIRSLIGALTGVPLRWPVLPGAVLRPACIPPPARFRQGESRPGPPRGGGLDQVLARRAPRLPEVTPGLIRARRQGPFRRLQVGHYADKALGQGVVDLPGQAAALLQHARAALSCGKLLAGRLELFHQLPALPALLDYGVDPEREEDPEEDRHRGYEHPGGPGLGRHQDAPHDQQRSQDHGDRDRPAHLEKAVDLGEHNEEEQVVCRVEPDQGEAQDYGPGRPDEHGRGTLDPTPVPDDHEPVPEPEQEGQPADDELTPPVETRAQKARCKEGNRNPTNSIGVGLE